MPRIEIGRTTAGMSVARGDCRNTNTTPMTSTTAIMRLRSVSPTAAVTDCDRSIAMCMVMLGGRVAWTDGSTFLICATVLMMFAPGSG